MQRLWFGAGLVLIVFGLAGMPLGAAAQSGTARVRVMHAAPDATAVDVFVDDQKVLSNVSFSAISDYLNVSSGQRQIALVPTGQPVSAAIISGSQTFEAGKAYTAIAVAEPSAAITVFNDDVSAPAPGKARVRLIHMSPDAPGVDVEVINGPTLFQSVAYQKSSSYQEVDAGTYNLRAVAAGATTVIVQLPNTSVKAGTIYDVIPAGRLANIQVSVATYTPPAAVAGASDDTASDTQQLMPNTGVNDMNLLVLGLGLFCLMAGIFVRRQAV